MTRIPRDQGDRRVLDRDVFRDFRVALTLFFDGNFDVPRKIRQLIAALEKHGFVNRGGKGSHYQQRDLKRAIERTKS